MTRFEVGPVETDISSGKFKVGDRVTRPRDVHVPMRRWKLMHGVVTRAYRRDHCRFGPYPELFDVRWDDEADRLREGYGYLPHGIDRETPA